MSKRCILATSAVPAWTGFKPVGTVTQQVELMADAVELFLFGHGSMPPFG
ncbi:MAG TPA: hypothetical protein VMI06_17495 [Terriglobia bacterium]|nr:hypothetical protein [Terriglobia bacterium]